MYCAFIGGLSPSCRTGRGLCAVRPVETTVGQDAAMPEPMTLLPPWTLLLPAMAVVFGAGMVRGFAGFGFSAPCVAGLLLFLAPARVVPPIFALEVLAGVTLLRGTWKDLDWPWLGWLVQGNALCIPLGMALLVVVPEGPLRALIGTLLLLYWLRCCCAAAGN
jgi:uncharacterized membrane protein YfcA